jgi:two-component system sensor histidine kinase BaeS
MGETVRLGPIGRRVLAAFLVVALTSIAVLAGATIIGVDLSRAEATRAQRAEMTPWPQSRAAPSPRLAHSPAPSWPMPPRTPR